MLKQQEVTFGFFVFLTEHDSLGFTFSYHCVILPFGGEWCNWPLVSMTCLHFLCYQINTASFQKGTCCCYIIVLLSISPSERLIWAKYTVRWVHLDMDHVPMVTERLLIICPVLICVFMSVRLCVSDQLFQ